MNEPLFNEIRYKISDLSEDLNEDAIKRVPDFRTIKEDCINLITACNVMIDFCNTEK